MKLYSFQPSPFGSRVRLAMYHKGIDFEVAPVQDVNPEHATFLASSPMEVPTLLVSDGIAISGSSVILDYLEDAYPTPSLRPQAPAQAALARMLVQVPDTYMQSAPRKLFGMANPADRNEAAVNEQVDLIVTALAFVEHRIRGTPWAVGNHVSIADCALVPILNAVSLLGAIHGRPDLITRHPKLATYWKAAQAEPTNARLIAEQLAGLPPGLQAFTKPQADTPPQRAA